MNQTPVILTINGGSSSIKFALFHDPRVDSLVRILSGSIDRIGVEGTSLQVDRADQGIPIEAGDHREAALALIDWLRGNAGSVEVKGIGHRVVHGGLHLTEHQVITDDLVAELKQTQPLDLAHLPREISLIETFHERFPGIPQVACFDTAFHRDLPRLAHLLPIPRSYDRAGIRRFGFHGLSYAYLMEELQRLAGSDAANGRVILAHLGSGASMAAVMAGRPFDTTMAFTPNAGLVMGTRPGDLDPGLLVYLMRMEKQTPVEMDVFISQRCGLLGVSEITSDMQALMTQRTVDIRAAEAVDLFCYQAKKWIGAYAAALGGLDTLVFSGGIGEHSPEVRASICEGLGFLGLHIDPERNERGDGIVSPEGGRVTVRVMKTDEEIMIAKAVATFLEAGEAMDEGTA